MPNMPKVIVRYEDLLDNCYNNFYKIIDFLSKILGFKINIEQLKFSIEFSDFEKLKKKILTKNNYLIINQKKY